MAGFRFRWRDKFWVRVTVRVTVHDVRAIYHPVVVTVTGTAFSANHLYVRRPVAVTVTVTVEVTINVSVRVRVRVRFGIGLRLGFGLELALGLRL